ncbi:MAG: NAD(P)-dependent oxidoreductase [Caldilineaceae bacterium]
MSYLVLTETQLPPQMMEMIGDRCRVVVWQGMETDPALLSEAEGFLTYGHPHIGPTEMDRMPNLRIISNFGVGVDHIDLHAAQERGIPVGNTPGFVDGATADMTFALLMAIARNIVVGDHHARSAAFTSYDPSILHGYEVHGATLGIVGMGAIGKQVARRATGFDMQILYHNRKPDPAAEAEVGATYAALPRSAGPGRLRHPQRAADAGDAQDDRSRTIAADEAYRLPHQPGPRRRRRPRRPGRSAQRRLDRRRRPRRHRAGAAAAGSSSAQHVQCHHRPASGQRHPPNPHRHGPADD